MRADTKSAVEAFETLLKERGERHYGRAVLYDEYGLYVVDETATSFVLSNGRGEPVSDERDINIQFMLMKDMLGFVTVEDGEYSLTTSKLSNSLVLNCLRLTTHQGWLVRVVREEGDALLGLTNESAPEGWECVPGTSFNVKWMPKGETQDILDFITGPRFGG